MTRSISQTYFGRTATAIEQVLVALTDKIAYILNYQSKLKER